MMKRIINSRFVEPEISNLFNRRADYLYSKIDFNMPQSQIHAYAHTERVLLHALSIGKSMFVDDNEALDILAHAALFHDTRRQDDYLDTGHGARAAVNYADFCRHHPELTFHPESQYLMRYHDLDDNVGIDAIRRDFSGPAADRLIKLYQIFKDADALDRWRLGDRGLDPRYLRTDKARSLVEFSRELVKNSMDPKLLHHIDMLVKSSLSHKILIIVDPQIDFINGSLPVPCAEAAMNSLSRYVVDKDGEYHFKIVTADRHPWDHSSFTDCGGQWPRHCTADSVGAAIWPPLLEALHSTAGETYMFHKGENAARDEYSIFANADAAQQILNLISQHKINKIDLCGLAGDYCVRATFTDLSELLPKLRVNLIDQFSPKINDD